MAPWPVINHFPFLVPPIPESSTDCQVIHEYEEIGQTKDKKSYENKEDLLKIYDSLKSAMEIIREHLQTTVSVCTPFMLQYP